MNKLRYMMDGLCGMVVNILDDAGCMPDDDDDDVEFFSYNIWTVDKAVALNDDGVNTSVFLYLASDTHEFELGVALHPKLAIKLAADLLNVAADS